MRTRDFYYELPEELIAQYPLQRRGDSRLLCLCGQSGSVADRRFAELPELLREGDLLVFNDTRVIPARLHGRKESGGKVEVLIERLLDATHALAHVRASKSPKPGGRILIEGGGVVEVQGREDALFRLHSPEQPLSDLFQQCGHMPLPPYTTRLDQELDQSR